jgi:hypothetical protein
MLTASVVVNDGDTQIIIKPKEIKRWGYLVLVGNGFEEKDITWNQYNAQNFINLKNDISDAKDNLDSLASQIADCFDVEW